MKIDWKTMKRPIVALSPMADMTDSAFCRLTKSIASPIVFREMVSAEAVIRGNDKTLGMAAIHNEERPLVQQIFGANVDSMREAARIIDRDFHPEGIDINMGCPVYKITSNFNGAALMKDVELATAIVRAMKEVITVPLSVKMRAGWSDHNECVEFAKAIEAAGADLITVHGRTKEQGYSGKARRDVVKAVKDAVLIPVLYNGDVFTWQDYFEALDETDCDGVLIARGGLGNPWIFKQIEEKLSGKVPEDITLVGRIDTVRIHLDLHLAQHGEDRLPTFRKHLSWYFKGIPGFKAYRTKMMVAPDRETLEAIFDSLLKEEA
jgi:tRNA-dihydrouridine synthase B